MTTTTTDRSGDKKKDKDDQTPRPVTPEASNPELADWMERLFSNGESCEKLHIVEICGKRPPYERGDIEDNEPFGPNGKQPTKESFVSLSNRFLAAAQRSCDVHQQRKMFCVEAFHRSKGADPFSRFPISFDPRGKRTGHSAEIRGRMPDPDDNEDARDSFGSDKLLRRFDNNEVHNLDMFKLLMQGLGQTMQLFEETLRDIRSENLQHRRDWIDLTRAIEAERSAQHQRNLDIMKQEFWLDVKREGIGYVKGMLPPLLNNVLKKKVVPEQKLPGGQNASTESLVLSSFVNSMKTEQAEAFFGKLRKRPDGTIEVLERGVLTDGQIEIIEGIITGSLAPETIDKIFEGGEHAITQEQFAVIGQIFSLQQLMPLQQLFDDIQKRRGTTAKEDK